MLKTKNGTFKRESKSLRHAVDNWKEGVNNMSEQIVNNVRKNIDNKVEKLVEVKDTIIKDADSVKQKIKNELIDELFKLNNQGRKCVQEEITKAGEIIVHNTFLLMRIQVK